MPATYEPIATTTLSSATNAITFSSIPSSYTDLKFVLNGWGGTNASLITLNNSGLATGNYSQTYINGDGGSASSGRYTNANYFLGSASASFNTTIPGILIIDMLSYSNNNTYKSCLISKSQDNAGTGGVEQNVGLWRNTSAINQITIQMGTGAGTFASGTTATLYGIKSA